MSLPDFTATAALGKSKRTYYGRYQYGSLSQNPSGGPASVMPSQMESLDAGDESSGMDEMGAEGLESDDMEGQSDEGESDEGESDAMDETEDTGGMEEEGGDDEEA